MKLSNILNRTVLNESNQATEYLTKLIGILRTTPADIPKANRRVREKIAYIITGLYVISNPKFRQTLSITDDQYKQIVTQMHTNTTAANYLVTAGKRLPSMATTYIKQLERFDRLSSSEQSRIFDILTKLTKLVSPSTPPTTTQLPNQQPNQQLTQVPGQPSSQAPVNRALASL